MWVTFKEGVAIYAALEKEQFQFGSFLLHFERAQNASDIKFENVGIAEKKHRCYRDIMLVLVVIFGTVFFFWGMELIKRLQILNFIKNPPLTDCDLIRTEFTEE